ncbi:hypothetical protein PR202_gb23246 [Eleusine coracana subsp. coracana]|uniref:Uncharacterized protein n=1 Tax=Eleusine coracana subsp. coracana TaxID=191504 RepID=A0AAV5FJD9_ELECO|nr:hypothetical protein PR202_gb23246 [Eleusine coracana subsp. coracana]
MSNSMSSLDCTRPYSTQNPGVASCRQRYASQCPTQNPGLRVNNEIASCRGRVPGTLRLRHGPGHVPPDPHLEQVAPAMVQRRVDGQQGPPDPSSYFTVMDVAHMTPTSRSASPPLMAPPRRCYVMVRRSGKLELQSWNNTARKGDVLDETPRVECSRYIPLYMARSAIAICDHTGGGVPGCSRCLEGFEPMSVEE